MNVFKYTSVRNINPGGSDPEHDKLDPVDREWVNRVIKFGNYYIWGSIGAMILAISIGVLLYYFDPPKP